MPERVAAGLVTGCNPSESWRATRRGMVLLAPAGVRTSIRPVVASSGTRNAKRPGRLIRTWAGWPSTRTAGGPKLRGPRWAPVSSISPRGNVAAGTMSSMRGSERVSAADWVLVRGILDPMVQQPRYTQSIQPRCHIVEDDAPSLGKLFELADGEGLGDVEYPEEEEGDQGVTPVGVAADEGDPLAGDLVDDDELGVLAAGFAGDNGGGGDAEQEGEGDSGQQQ